MNDVSRTPGAPALIAHVVFEFHMGGLENGLVNLVNNLPRDRFRHAVIVMTSIGAFRSRIEHADVEFFTIDKRPGKDPGMYGRLWKLFRRLRPAIVHTRNVGTLDVHLAARAARAGRQVHGLHGWAANDLHGTNKRHALLRRVCDPFVDRYIAVSRDLAQWLSRVLPGTARHKIQHICNGVDTARFHPAPDLRRHDLLPPGFLPPGGVLFGWVGRMDAVKDPMLLVESFISLVKTMPEARQRARLALIGDGSLYAQVEKRLVDADVAPLAWLAGARDDVPDLMRALDVFVLPSRNEGIANTLLEALASGLPVVATAVGGNPELLENAECGVLIPADDPPALREAMASYLLDGARRAAHATAARRHAEQHFSLSGMIAAYTRVYDELLRAVPSRS